MNNDHTDIDALRAELARAQTVAKVRTEQAERAERELAEANREIGSQRATIRSLCDRLDKIHRIAIRPGSMKARLAEIAEWSGGFAPEPKG